jgi:sigma-B regulation protein RsbU (phosphoserine phosphatase)
MFRLLRYFSLTSLVAFIIVAVLLGQLLLQRIYWTEETIFAGVAVLLALLYIVLFFIVRRANTIIQQQSTALRESQHQLQESYQREQQRRQLSDTLGEVTRIVSSSLEQKKVVDLILGQLENVIPYHRATVSLLEGETLTLIEGRDKMGGAIKPYSFRATEYPINVEVLTSKQPVLVPDVTRDTRWHQTSSMRGIHSFISAPLLVQDQPIGILAVGKLDDVPYTEEETQTVFAFATQVAIAMRNAQLHAEVRHRIDQELKTAQQIQKSLLPIEVPDIPGLDIAGYSQPAWEVGGDFYNFSVFEQKHLGIAVGDVSGKGMQAALMMALSFGLLTSEVNRVIAPASLMMIMNRVLQPHTKYNKMNTALGYMTLVPSQNVANAHWDLSAANAGLIAPLLRHRDGTVEWIDVTGLPLGTVKEAEYRELHQSLEPGDLVFLTTDGVVEAMNADGEMYGFDRLVQSVAASTCQTAETTLESVLTDLQSFVGNAETQDDLTMVVVMVTDQ